ncbi:MlaD family protein [Ramlibacter sp.]|uniref:MlaD family protein n=1 Tax=Ramlibacter sp. TaxID=1917967 RepID=UPI003D1263EB
MAETTPPDPTAPPEPATPGTASEPAAKLRRHSVRHLELKAALLVVFTMALLLGAALYVLHARGFFEPKQRLVLIADDSEGVVPGMDMTFSGFPIGRVRHVELGDKGNVRITVDVNKHDARWLRTSSVFTLVRGLVGGAQLRAYSGVLTDPALADGAERPVLRGDANAELQRVIGAARDVFDNLNEITGQNSELNRMLGNLQTFSQKLQGRQGALHAIFGNEEDARKLVMAVERAQSAMARIEAVAARAEQIAAKADTQVFGADGLLPETRNAVRQAHALLADARNSMKRVDAVLAEAQGAAGNVKTATQDLGALRLDVEANLRKIEDMINDINRKWPFAKERKIELP